jgi:CheY-like chemotaxis protein
MGNEVRTASDGVAALEAAEQFRPEVILMDVGTPRLNGLDAMRRIREQVWDTMPIIALTAGRRKTTGSDRARPAAMVTSSNR